MISLERTSSEDNRVCIRKNLLIALLALFLLVAVSSFSVLKVGFYLDDFTYIKLLHFYPLEMFWQGCTGRQMLLPAFGEHFRPALSIFYLIDSLCCGLNPALFHVSNLIWHLIASYLVFLVSLRLLPLLRIDNSQSISWWTAVIFAVHPLHVESLCWWTGKNDIVCAVFYLSGYLSFLTWKARGRRLDFVLSICFYLLALLCKESAVSFPFLLLITDALIKNKSEEPRLARLNWRVLIPFFVILLLFWLIRFAALKTWLGSYYGLAAGNWLAFFLEHGLRLREWLILFYPVDQNIVGVVSTAICILLSIIYGYALCNSWLKLFARDAAYCRAFLLLAGSFVLFIAPACLIWFPQTNFLASRLLYLALFPVSCLCPLMLMAGGETTSPEATRRLNAHLALAALLMSFVFSSYHYQQRWIAATEYFEHFRTWLSFELRNNKQIALLNIPHEVQGIPVFSHFFILQDSLQKPFDSGDYWQNLKALAPTFFADPQLINASRIRELSAGSCRFLDANVADKQTIKSLPFVEPVMTDKYSAKSLQLSCISQGEKGGKNYSYVRVPESISGMQYSHLMIHFKAAPQQAGKIRLLWKTPEMKVFSQSRQRVYALRANEKELRLHPGELFSWLNCRQIDGIELEYEKGVEPVDLVLDAEEKFSAQVLADPHESSERSDSVLQAKNGSFKFSYDVSAIPEADSVLVEISPPGLEFSAATEMLQENRESPLAIKRFYVKGRRGAFSLSDELGSPYWHQLRILPRNSQNQVVGFSSDPLFIQSRTAHQLPLASFLLPYNASGVSK